MRFHDESIPASDPVQISLSLAKLRKLKVPRNVDMLPSDLLNEHLGFGDSRAAVVVSTEPLLVAAYTDELDCVVLLRFQPELVGDYGLEVGSRLLTVNTYTRNPPLAPDLVPGPESYDRWFNYFPLIADFLTEDMPAVEARKAAIAEAEWQRARSQGARALKANPQPLREGHPYASETPLRSFEPDLPPPTGPSFAPATSGFAVYRRPKQESTALEWVFAHVFLILIGIALGAFAGAFLPVLSRRRFARNAGAERIMNEDKSAAIARATVGAVVGAIGAVVVAAASAKPGAEDR